MANTISRRITGRVRVRASKRAKSHERRYPITNTGKRVSRFKL